MSEKSAIEWTDTTWNPVRGCTKVSPGCANCYAETFAERWRGVKGHPYEQGFDLRLVPDKLTEPLSWKKPRRVFVNSMSDLFHDGVDYDFIVRVFAVMQQAWRHTFQVLTKRPARMLEIVGHPSFQSNVSACAGIAPIPWPLPNVWLGCSVENQHFADERIPLLLQTPAAVRFISAEPLLGPVSFRWAKWDDHAPNRRRENPHWPPVHREGRLIAGSVSHLDGLRMLDWVIVGGESGPGARPCDMNWIRRIAVDCHNGGVPVFVKQLGAHPISADVLCRFDSYEQWVNKARSWLGGVSGGGLKYKEPERAVCIDARGRVCAIGRDFMRARDDGAFPVTAHPVVWLHDAKGGDPAEWPEDLRVRQFPETRG